MPRRTAAVLTDHDGRRAAAMVTVLRKAFKTGGWPLPLQVSAFALLPRRFQSNYISGKLLFGKSGWRLLVSKGAERTFSFMFFSCRQKDQLSDRQHTFIFGSWVRSVQAKFNLKTC